MGFGSQPDVMQNNATGWDDDRRGVKPLIMLPQLRGTVSDKQ